MNLTAARQALADALSTVEGVDVRARPFRAAPKPGDGWVTVQRLAPADFVSCTVTLAAVVTLGADQAQAEQLLEEYAVALVDAVTTSDLGAADVTLEPQTVAVGSAALFAVVLTASLPAGGDES